MPLWSYLENGGTRGVAIWHRRSGKDDVCLHWSASSMFRRVGSYWHMLPEASQARKAIWNAVNPHTGKRRIDEAFPEEIRANINEQEMFIRTKNGSTWQVIGSDNYNSLVGSPPVGVVFSEWALAKPGAWAYLRPILAENGGWAAFITTSRGNNHAKTTFDLGLSEDGWFAEKLTAKDTDVFTQEQLDQELREYIADYGEDEGRALFEQEYMCSFDSAVLGSYYGKDIRRAEESGRIGNVPYDPAVPVDTWWDIGVGDNTSIGFTQAVGKEVRFIDHYSMSGEGLPHYAKILQDKNYIYGNHYGPHDIEVREFGSGRSRIETAKSLGIKFRVVPKLSIDDGINAVRTMFSRFWFDRNNCKGLIDSLREYHKEWNEKQKTFLDRPCHDWSSHDADMVRYFAVGFKDQVDSKPRPPRRPVKRSAAAWMGA